MKSPMKCKHPILKIVLIVWVVFSVLYVGYTQYKYFTNFVYQKGVADAVVQVIQQAQECKAFPVVIEEQGVQLVNVACLSQPEKGGDTGE